MKEWKEEELGKHIKHKKGYAFKSTLYEKVGHLVVRVSDTTDNSIDINSCVRINENLVNTYHDYKLRTNDIVIMTVGSWPENPRSVVGKVIRVPQSADGALLNQNAVRVRVKDKELNCNIFMYYALKAPAFFDYIVSGAQGSASQASITLKDVFLYKLLLPPLPEQKAIAQILSSLDDKIELFKRQNKTLEQIAEALFRQWFVEEADADWEEVRLEDVAEVRNGKSFKSSDFIPIQDGALEVVKMGHIERGGGLKKNPKKDYILRTPDLDRYILEKGDIIMAMTDMKDNVVILGVSAMIDKSDFYALNQRVARISLRDNSKLRTIYSIYNY